MDQVQKLLLTEESSRGQSRGARPAKPPFARTRGRSTGAWPLPPLKALLRWASSPRSSSAPRPCADAALKHILSHALLSFLIASS